MKRTSKMRRIVSLFMAVLLFGLPTIPIQAEEQRAGITICYQGAGDDGNCFLSKMSVKLYQVGTSGVGGTLKEEFQDSGLFLENLESLPASEQQKQAEKLAAYAREKQISCKEKETDENGEVSFENLSYGLYLVVPQSFYHVENGSFLASPFFVSLPLQGNMNPRLNPKIQWADGITIGLEELVTYTGGNELREEEPDGFPEPRYTGIPENVEWRINGSLWEKEKYPFTVTYTIAEDKSGTVDSGITAENDKLPGIYFAHIKPVIEGAIVTCSADGFETEQKVIFETGRLIVRNISENRNDNQLGAIVSVSSPRSQHLTQQQLTDLANGIGTAVIPDDSVITVNGKAELGTVEINDTGLLFDEVLYNGKQNTGNRKFTLEQRVEKGLKNRGISTEGRKYQSRYLDLVAHQDGNLWLSSGEGMDVYWPYPEGTDKNCNFTMFHFPGIHREYGILGNADLSGQVQNAQMEKVQLEKTEVGLKFHVTDSGFSPFVLSWTGKSGEQAENPKTPIEKVINSVKTGDATPILLLVMVLIISGGVLIGMFVKRKKRK